MLELLPETLEKRREKLLNSYKTKQSFRVSIGKSPWKDYVKFNPRYNLREILNNEVVIEFDCNDKALVKDAVDCTKVNLLRDKQEFTIWDHGGKSPHFHIHDLPIAIMDKTIRTKFKKVYMRHYVPEKFHKWLDLSLAGTHLVAIEWAEHWKGIYHTKMLIADFSKSALEKRNEELQHERLMLELKEKKMRMEFNRTNVYKGTMQEYMKEVFGVVPGAIGPTKRREIELGAHNEETK